MSDGSKGRFIRLAFGVALTCLLLGVAVDLWRQSREEVIGQERRENFEESREEARAWRVRVEGLMTELLELEKARLSEK